LQQRAGIVRRDADGGVELELDGTSPLSWRIARVERKRYWHDVMDIQ